MDWHVLLSTFGLIFVAELGDKTQLAVVTQVCRHSRPWAVFLGASLALAAVTALGAIGGQARDRRRSGFGGPAAHHVVEPAL